MGYKIGTKTFTTTGLVSVNLGAPSTPTHITAVVQNKNATNEGSLKHISIGTSDGTNHVCTSYIKNGTVFDTRVTTGAIIKVYEHIAGVNTVVLEVAFDSFLSNGVKFNVITANGAYSAYLMAEY